MMSVMIPRLAVAAALAFVGGVDAGFAAAAAPGAPVDFALTLSSRAPSTATEAGLYIRYRAPGSASGKPSPLRRVVLEAPAGSRFDGGAVPACHAGDGELILLGRAACPAASRVGGGTVTAVSGFGPPLDPVTLEATFFNTGRGLLQLLTVPGTGVAAAVVRGRFSAPNTIAFDHLPSVPGGPPDFGTAVRTVDVRVGGGSRRAFLTTPPACPPGREWASQLTYTTADGHTYTAQSTSACLDGASSAPSRPLSFSGTCRLSGDVRFLPPLTTATRRGRVTATAVGTCSGTLSDPGGHVRSVGAAPVDAVAQSEGSESCEAGVGAGSGYLAFGGRRLRFTYHEVRAGPALILRADGADSGGAVAEGNVSPSANPLTVLRSCSAGGLHSAPIDLRLATVRAISG
jgi:hypothetical protein